MTYAHADNTLLRKALRIQERMANCYKITSHPIILTGIYKAQFHKYKGHAVRTYFNMQIQQQVPISVIADTHTRMTVMTATGNESIQ